MSRGTPEQFFDERGDTFAAHGWRGTHFEDDVPPHPGFDDEPEPHRRANGHAGAKPQSQLPSISDAGVARWHGIEPADLEFVVADFIPKGMVTLLSAEGGAGKSLLEQLAITSVAAGIPFIGKSTTGGAAAGVFAEDPDAVLHLRQARICKHIDRGMDMLGDRLFVQSYFGLDAALWADGKATAFMVQLERDLRSIVQLEFVALDNSALLYRGDESDRGEVTAFISALNGLADRLNIGLLLTAHASKSHDGSALRVTSGSTAWVNACRSVIELRAATDDNPASFRLVKSNHARTGVEVQLEWRDALLLPVHQAGGILGAIERRAAVRVFLDLLDAVTAEGRAVSDSKNATNFAPRTFSSRPDREGYSSHDFARAMEQLFADRRIEMVGYGRVGDHRRKIARTSEKADG